MRIIPPIYLALTIICMVGMDMALPLVQLWEAPFALLGIALAGAGAVLMGVAIRQFRRHDTGIHPFSPATHLITHGIYRYTRNPIYLGMLLITLGVAVWFGTLGALLPLPLFWAVLEWKFVRREEPFLRETFGEAYDAYRQKVRRWF